MSSPIVGVGLINAVIFGVYGNTLRALHRWRLRRENEASHAVTMREANDTATAIAFGAQLYNNNNNSNAGNASGRGSEEEDDDDDDEEREYAYADVFLAGAIAGGINCIVATPIELVKCQL